MKVTELTRKSLKVRKERRDMLKSGWEEVSEGGGKLWELHRGYRWNHNITDVRISCTGKSLWVKVQREAPCTTGH